MIKYIIKKISMICLIFLFAFLVSCVTKSTNNVLEYDFYFELKDEGVYVINELFNLEFINNENITLERIYGNLLFFRHRTEYTWLIYNYITKNTMDISMSYIHSLAFVSENEIKITGNSISNLKKEDEIIIKFPHDEKINKIIDFNQNDNRNFFYYSVYDNYDFIEKGYNFVEMYNKIICINLNKTTSLYEPVLEVSYDNFHNIYFLCVYTGSGKE